MDSNRMNVIYPPHVSRWVNQLPWVFDCKSAHFCDSRLLWHRSGWRFQKLQGVQFQSRDWTLWVATIVLEYLTELPLLYEVSLLCVPMYWISHYCLKRVLMLLYLQRSGLLGFLWYSVFPSFMPHIGLLYEQARDSAGGSWTRKSVLTL